MAAARRGVGVKREVEIAGDGRARVRWEGALGGGGREGRRKEDAGEDKTTGAGEEREQKGCA